MPSAKSCYATENADALGFVKDNKRESQNRYYMQDLGPTGLVSYCAYLLGKCSPKRYCDLNHVFHNVNFSQS